MTRLGIDTKLDDIAQMKKAKHVDLNVVINEANDDLERALFALENIILYTQQRAQVREDAMQSTSQENVAPENIKRQTWKLNVLRSVPLFGRRLRLARNLRILPGPKEKAQANTRVHQDEILSNMKVCMTQQTTMLPQEFYELFVHQGDDVLNSFYREQGFHSVTIGQVELSSEDVQFREPWSNESFTGRRSLSFSLPVSPHDVQVHAKHHCRLEGDSRFILDISSWTTGEWYSDLFEVHARWTVDKVGATESNVNCGIFVEIVRHIASADMATAGLYRVIALQQLALMEQLLSIKDPTYVRGSIQGAGIVSAAQEGHEIMKTKDQIKAEQCCLLAPWKQWEQVAVVPGNLLACDEDLFDKFHLARRMLREVDTILKQPGRTARDTDYFLAQLSMISESLDRIVFWEQPGNRSKLESRESIDRFLKAFANH